MRTAPRELRRGQQLEWETSSGIRRTGRIASIEKREKNSKYGDEVPSIPAGADLNEYVLDMDGVMDAREGDIGGAWLYGTQILRVKALGRQKALRSARAKAAALKTSPLDRLKTVRRTLAEMFENAKAGQIPSRAEIAAVVDVARPLGTAFPIVGQGRNPRNYAAQMMINLEHAMYRANGTQLNEPVVAKHIVKALHSAIHAINILEGREEVQ